MNRLLFVLLKNLNSGFFLLSVYYYFLLRNKSVALVGNSSELLHGDLGGKIDAHDFVVRLNFNDITDKEQFLGTKTDMRFIGATLLAQHEALVKSTCQNVLIITTDKNKAFFKRLGLEAFFYDRKLPFLTLKKLDTLLAIQTKFHQQKIKPPRTGLVCLVALINAIHHKNLSIFGVSTELEHAGKHLSYTDNRVLTYDPKRFVEYHCDLSIEVSAIKAIAENLPVSFIKT